MADSAHEQLQAASLARLKVLELPRVDVSNIRRANVTNDDQGAALLLNLSMPAVILTTYLQQEEYPTADTVNGRDDTVLPILVLLLSHDLWNQVEFDAWATEVRELIRRAFRTWRPSVTGGVGVFGCEVGPGPIVRPAVDGKDILASTFTLRWRVREPRTVVA